MLKVLFVCVHNSARSQMAEAFLKQIGGKDFLAESAGLEPAPLNPIMVEAMSEIGYDLSDNQTHSVFDYFNEGRRYAMVVKVCDEINGQRCPIFPLTLKNINWNLHDPEIFTGPHDERLEQMRSLRDEIKEYVEAFVSEYAELAASI
ncbi:arsenate reductase ArsC [Eubacteriaceae bacterium ES3]|nr:arsenate reductase ArsC [Eubacteriaceae bacterium ES3]